MKTRKVKDFKVRNGLRTVSYYKELELSKKKKEKLTILSIYVIFSFIMTIVNYFYSFNKSFYISLILGFGFLICIILEKTFNKSLLSDILCSALINIILTSYVIFEENEGFGLFFVLVLIPLYCTFNKTLGIISLTYTLLLVFCVCLFPTLFNITNLYSDTFLIRFPILCICDYLIYYLLYKKNKID